jgi:hypothetical protein
MLRYCHSGKLVSGIRTDKICSRSAKNSVTTFGKYYSLQHRLYHNASKMHIKIFTSTFYLGGIVSTTPKRIVAYFMKLFIGLYSTQKKSTANTVNTTQVYTGIYEMNFLSRVV